MTCNRASVPSVFIKKQKGFSFLELTLVIVVISFLVFLGFNAYQPHIRNSQIESIRFQANAFSRTVGNLRAQRALAKSISPEKKYIVLERKKIFFNEKGWPANTNAKSSAKSWNQTPQECEQLWLAIYENPPAHVLDISKKKSESIYLISSINGRICRYELLRKQEGNYFFDYHLNTGKVISSYPES